VRRSRRVFAALLKLLFECGEFGKRRIRIGLLVATARIAERLGIVTLTFGPIDALAAFASRAATTQLAAILPLAALPLLLHALLPLVALLAFFAAGSLGALAWRAARTARRCGCIGRWRCGGRAFRRRRCAVGHDNLCLRLTMRTARTMRTTLGAAGRAPHFDERRLLGGLRFR